jgi:hypothetical protein
MITRLSRRYALGADRFLAVDLLHAMRTGFV